MVNRVFKIFLNQTSATTLNDVGNDTCTYTGRTQVGGGETEREKGGESCSETERRAEGGQINDSDASQFDIVIELWKYILRKQQTATQW